MTQVRALSLTMTEAQNESIREVIQVNGKRLFDFIRNRVREPEEAEDIFQDVMFELTESFRMVQPIEKMAAWLFKVARNKITDKYRKKRPYLLDDRVYYSSDGEEELYLQDLLKSTTMSPDSDFDQALLWEAIEQALDELPKEQRDVFVKHELEDISFKQMVDETGLSLNTLLSRKRYAILHLRKRLKEFYDDLLN